MRKNEVEQRQRESNAMELNSRISDFFSKRRDREFTVRVLYRNEVDWDAYRKRSLYPMQIIKPPEETEALFVGFKRNENVPDIEWDESFRQMAFERF